ncbi:MAG: sodium:calcium antiporter, partial [Gammaproteobacteria bacterium]|nr:sodium:calcium antiporter [Gammaproteobacteria bacterium]
MTGYDVAMSLILAVIVIIIALMVMTQIIDKHFIKSLDNIAEYFKMPQSIAGATLLAFGTSAPEISTALFALFLASASPAIGVGTIVGSAIFQILVVIGFAAIVKTAYLNWQPVVRDSAVYAIAIILLMFFIWDGVFTFTESLILVLSYGGYLILLYFWAKYLEKPSEPDPIEMVEEGV